MAGRVESVDLDSAATRERVADCQRWDVSHQTTPV